MLSRACYKSHSEVMPGMLPVHSHTLFFECQAGNGGTLSSHSEVKPVHTHSLPIQIPSKSYTGIACSLSIQIPFGSHVGKMPRTLPPTLGSHAGKIPCTHPPLFV